MGSIAAVSTAPRTRAFFPLLVALVLLSFLVPFVFSSVLTWPRNLYLVPYVTLVGGVTVACLFSGGFHIGTLRQNWLLSLLVAGVISVLAINNLGANHARSPMPQGVQLVGLLFWLGQVYGTMDALVLSLIMTLVYHLGYAEFRGIDILSPVLGNTIFTAAYLVTRNPISPVLAHVAMHVASVLTGLATYPTLPPHY